MKMLVVACESAVPGGVSEDGRDSFSDERVQADGSSGSDSLNHRAFKTVQLFKSSAILSIYELVSMKF